MIRTAERGFTLLEAIFAIGLSTTVVFGVTAAVLGSLHATNRVVVREALTDDALNVLSDLRTATAYDATLLASLIGRSSTSTLVRDGKRLTIDVSVTRAVPHSPIVAHVTVSDENGVQTSEQQQLYAEAPAPGSVVEGPTPGPGN